MLWYSWKGYYRIYRCCGTTLMASNAKWIASISSSQENGCWATVFSSCNPCLLPTYNYSQDLIVNSSFKKREKIVKIAVSAGSYTNSMLKLSYIRTICHSDESNSFKLGLTTNSSDAIFATRTPAILEKARKREIIHT